MPNERPSGEAEWIWRQEEPMKNPSSSEGVSVNTHVLNPVPPFGGLLVHTAP